METDENIGISHEKHSLGGLWVGLPCLYCTVNMWMCLMSPLYTKTYSIAWCASLNLWLKLWQWATSKCYINILNSCIVKTLQGLDWEADENQGCQFWVNKMNKTHCTNATQIQDKYIHVDVCTACLWAWATGMLPRTEKSLFTESMTPRRAWKPPNTGNTCSMVSAMVASYKGREVETDREVWKEERGQKK